MTDAREPDEQRPTRLIDGATFILDAPDHIPGLWGRGDSVLWAEGEACTIGGGPGVGKTTVAGQVVLAGITGGGEVLGLPVDDLGRVLWLAMDRPQQIRRALRRTFRDLPRDVLVERFVAWNGPPLMDVARNPFELLRMAREAGADTLIVDSLKDAAVGLTEDAVAAGYNRARQTALAAGVQLMELHHLVKRGANGARPDTLADVYGSAWLTAGSGSVILLNGDAGDPIVELKHVKQPAAEVGPFRIAHDHEAGTSTVWHGTDLVAVARVTPGGLTAKGAAVALFSTEKPTTAQIEKARRRLDTLV